MSTLESTVKWFDAKKGYGFINHPEGGDDIFVHYSQIESDDDFKTLRTGQAVEFEMEDGPKGLHALNVVADEDGEAEETAEASSPAPGDDATEDPALGEDDASFDATAPRKDLGRPDPDDASRPAL